MNAPIIKKVLVDSGELRKKVAALFQAVGVSAEHADQIAEVVVFADLRGVESHGVQFTPRYVRGIARGHCIAHTLGMLGHKRHRLPPLPGSGGP